MAPWPCDEVRVLLLDDEQGFREAVAECLRTDGHPVFAYAEPSAVPAASSLQVDCIVTDYDLPGQHGLAFLAQYRAVHPGTPTILLTGSPAMIEPAIVRRLGITVETKPIEYDLLHRRIHDLVARGGRHRAVG